MAQKGIKQLSSESLFNLSPLDGRYASDLQDVQDMFSESRLIRERIHVESPMASEDLGQVVKLTSLER